MIPGTKNDDAGGGVAESGSPARVSIKLSVFPSHKEIMPEQILLRQQIKEFLNNLRIQSRKNEVLPVAPYLETKSMFEQADFHVARQFNKTYRTTVGAINTNFLSWLPITSPNDLLLARNRNLNLKLRTQQTLLKTWVMVSQIENQHNIEAWEAITKEENFVNNIEKYMYNIGILGESLFLNEIRKKPPMLAQTLLRLNLNLMDANTLAEFILFRLYHPCMTNSLTLAKTFFQNLLRSPSNDTKICKRKIDECVMNKLYLMPDNLRFLKSLLNAPFSNLCNQLKQQHHNSPNIGNDSLSMETLIQISLSIYKIIINRKSTRKLPSLLTYIIYRMKNSDMYDGEDIIDLLVNKFVYPYLLKRVRRNYVGFSCRPNVSKQRNKLSTLNSIIVNEVQRCGQLLKLFTTVGPLNPRGKDITELGSTFKRGNNANGAQAICSFINNINSDLRKYEHLFVNDVCIIGKNLEWIDAKNHDSAILNSSLDINVATVGEIEEFKRILENNENNNGIKSIFAKYRQNDRYYNSREKNIIRPLVTVQSIKPEQENVIKSQHINVMELFNRLYYLINDHDAGADDELRYVFKEIHQLLPCIEKIETYHSTLRIDEEKLASIFKQACVEFDHVLRYQTKLKRRDTEDVSFISKKERRQTLSLQLNHITFPSATSPLTFDFKREDSFDPKIYRHKSKSEKKTLLDNYISVNNLKSAASKQFHGKHNSKKRRVSTYERPPNWKDAKAQHKVDALRLQKEKNIEAECTFQPNTEKIRREQHKKLGIKPGLFPTRVWARRSSRNEYGKNKVKNKITKKKVTSSWAKTPTRRQSLTGNTIFKPKRNTLSPKLSSHTNETAEPIEDMSEDDEFLFSDCLNDDAENEIMQQTHTNDSRSLISSDDEEKALNIKFPVPLVSRRELLHAFNIVRANDIHNNTNVCEIVRQLFVNEALKSIFRIANNKSLIPIPQENVHEDDQIYDDTLISFDLSLSNGFVLQAKQINLNKNLPHQIEMLLAAEGVDSSIEKNSALRQILRHLASLTEASVPTLSKLILSLSAITGVLDKRLTFDALVNKFEQMEAIPPLSDPQVGNNVMLETSSQEGSKRNDKSSTLKALRHGAIFYLLRLSSDSDGIENIKSQQVHLALSSDGDRIFRRSVTATDQVGKRKFYFSISTIEKLTQGLSKELDQLQMSVLSNISPWLCFTIKTSDYASGRQKTIVLQAESVQMLNIWVNGFRYLIDKKREKYGVDPEDEIVDSSGKMLWARVKSRMRRASRIQNSTITKTFIKALGVDKDVTKSLREKRVSDFIERTGGIIPVEHDSSTHSRLVRDGYLYIKHDKKGFFSSKWRRRYVTLNVFLPMDFPGHLDEFETMQPYAELNYYQGEELRGSIRIDKNSIVMRIDDQRNLEFQLRRNISTMRRKSQIDTGFRYDVALKAEKNEINNVSKWCKSIRLVIQLFRLYDKGI
eukprot:g1665.t1